VAVHVPEEALLAGVHHLHRLARVAGEQGDVDLERHVFAGPERATDAAEREAHLLRWQPEARRDLQLVGVQPLGRHEHVDATVLRRQGQRRLGTEERLVLHADLVRALDDHQPRLVDVVGRAMLDEQVAEDVAVGVQRRRLEGDLRIDHGLHHLVRDRDRLRRQASGLGVVGRHDGDRLAVVADDLRRQHRLVGVLEPEQRPARYVGGGEHGAHAVHHERRGDVDRDDPRRGVRRPQRAAEQHAVGPHVVAEGELARDLGDTVRPASVLADQRATGPRPGAGAAEDVGHDGPPPPRARTTTSTASKMRP
jgi:hypothetical protein